MQGRGVRSASPRNAYQERRTQAQVSIDTNKDKMNPKKEVRVGIARGADQKIKAKCKSGWGGAGGRAQRLPPQ